MSFDYQSFESFCNGWLDKANNYELNNLSDYYDKFFTTFVVFNRLYNEAGKILIKRNASGIRLPKYKYAPLPDRASATDYVVRYYGENRLKNEIKSNQPCVNATNKLVKFIEDGVFYFSENYETGQPDTRKDLLLASKSKTYCPKSILSIVYAARCNMFHGSKEYNEQQKELMNNLIFILEFVTRRIFEKISNDIRTLT